ncbi:MAG: serine hydrolase [Chthoniobacterales bacterium]
MAEAIPSEKLRDAIEKIARGRETVACAVSVHDFETGADSSFHGDRLFHAASTIKVAILLALFKAVDEGRIRLTDPLHVRNRFRSALDGTPFRLDPNADGYPQLYKSVGRTARVAALAESMIIWSSNLATNLLLDHLGVEYATQVLAEAGVSGVHLRRGVADDRAHGQGLNNETTADGLVQLFATLRSDFLTKPSRGEVILILLSQKFTSMIPAGLPSHATVAHKTGEISTACHDVGIVYLPEREPYIVAILTEVTPEKNGRRETVKRLSEAVYEGVTGKKVAS